MADGGHLTMGPRPKCHEDFRFFLKARPYGTGPSMKSRTLVFGPNEALKYYDPVGLLPLSYTFIININPNI